MIGAIKIHKKAIIIACAAILICSVLAVVFVSQHNKPDNQEALPPGRIYDTGVFGGDITVHDSAEGEVFIEAEITPIAAEPLKTTDNPEAVWNADTYAGNHTPVEKALMKNGSIGVLTIPTLNLSVNVYESPDNMEAMSKGIAHFPSTSAFDGNVGLSAHNINMDSSDGYFKYLYTLKNGDTIRYMTALRKREYSVESVSAIAASDWSKLGHTDDNRLTLITCISGQPGKRLCVTATEKIPA